MEPEPPNEKPIEILPIEILVTTWSQIVVRDYFGDIEQYLISKS
jgi:hypothetical protein